MLKRVHLTLARGFSTQKAAASLLHRSRFESIIGAQNVLGPEQDITKFTRDWQNQYGGPGSLVLFPRNTTQVSEIMKVCNDNRICVVPQSGNTSLVAGATPVEDEVVLSLSKMNQIEAFDEQSGIVRCQAGVILQELQNFVGSKGYATPYDLGARGSCMVGGNLSTMACGIHFVKYGSLRNYVLGLEVVLPDGKILDMMGHLRKDNTGPDLKQLFIGSEGTLGIITRTDLLCPQKDSASKLIFLKTRGYSKVLELHQRAKSHFKKSLGAIEYLDLPSYSLVQDNQPGLRFPYNSKQVEKDSYFMLIEVTGRTESEVEESMEKFCEDAEALTDDILTCKNKAEERNFWEIRERVAESCNRAGDVLKYDFSINVSRIEELLEYVRKLMGESAKLVSGYAHIGDGNVHMNIVVNDKLDWKQVQKQFEPKIIQKVVEMEGSISAEHGIGSCKSEYLKEQKTPQVVEAMRSLKSVFDPNGILNPTKVFN